MRIPLGGYVSSAFRASGVAAICAVGLIACDADDESAAAYRTVTTYLDGVASRLSAQLPPERRLSVNLDRSELAQIYITPEGRVNVSIGFLFAAAGESELACAMAHEAAHLDALRTAASGDSSSSDAADAPRWSEDAERAADEAGTELCWQAGYNARALPILLERLAGLLRSTDAEAARSVGARAASLHSFLNGRNWTGERGYTRYQRTMLDLVPDSGSALDDDAARLIPIPVPVPVAIWTAFARLYEDGNEATSEFVGAECEAGDLLPSNEIDAFGHCWFGCEGTRRFGESATWILGTAHEEWRENEREHGTADHDSYGQDVANQGRGRSMADEEGSCLDLCADALHRGLLDLSAPERLYYDCEAGEMIDPEGEENVDGDDDGAGSSRTGQSWGDPHIVTGDHYNYDFQAGGEFIAIESPDDDLRVHVRQDFWNDARTVSRNTAVAARVHEDVVGLYVLHNALVIQVNSAEFDVPELWGALPGGGEIRSSFESVHLRWKDGTTLTVRVFTDFLNVYFEPASARSGRIRGLLGNFDGSADNELALRDGTRVVLPKTSDPGYATVLYGRFANSWRVPTDERMFEYPNGMRELISADLEPPSGLVSVAGLDVESGGRAEVVCRAAGIRAQPTLDDCILDVATTSRDSFAAAAADAAGTSGQRSTTATIAGSGTHVIDRFVGAAGERYFFQTLDLTGSLDLSRWELVAPNGEIVFGRCLRCNQPGEVELPADGVYVSRIVVSGAESGALRTLSHRVPAEQIFDVEVPATIAGGPSHPGSGRIEAAGGADVYRFPGTAGDAWRIVLETGDAKLGFGEWSLSTPDGEPLFATILPLAPSLPVDVQLPQSGIYTLRITGGSNWPALSDAGYGSYSVSISLVE